MIPRSPGIRRHPARNERAATRWPWLVALWVSLGALPLHAELQFDVFVGFDDRVREGHWFPVAFEVQNDGPTFTGLVSFAPEGDLDARRRSFTLELPTGTRKRVVIPVFSASGRYARWEAHLRDASGKVVGERVNLAPRDIAAQIPVLGALPRTFGGLPSLPEPKDRAPEFLPTVVRLQSEYLPANPIALEALTACYLNSEKAADLKPEAVEALLAWLHQGGHLILGIEQPGDLAALPWLRGLLPFIPETLVTRPLEGSFERWLVSGKRALQLPSALRRGTTPRRTNRPTRPTPPGPTVTAVISPNDPFTQIQPQEEFNRAEMPVITGRVRDGDTILSLGDLPLIQSAPRGQGTLTVLAFSPEREPFRSWKNRSWFWAKLMGVPPELLANAESIRDGTSIDGIFGAMLDSRQVRKLPVAALLLLLVVYLVVIGPFDQWILKRTGRQMWTWVTFPVYVVVFSGLIYFIGYRLRAGDLEWNELQVVDQLPRADGVALRGRTWVSIYSPANARYRMASDMPFVTLRGEFQPGGFGRTDAGRLSLVHPPRGIQAEAYVPVWVNQLYASDWLDLSPVLLTGSVTGAAGTTPGSITLSNLSKLNFEGLRLVVGDRFYDLGPLPAGGTLNRDLAPAAALTLDDFLATRETTLATVRQRRQAFGSQGSGQLPRGLEGVMMASLSAHVNTAAPNLVDSGFSPPSAFDLNHLLDRGEAVLFAWAPGQSIAPALNRFTPRRLVRDTALRVALPVTTTR